MKIGGRKAKRKKMFVWGGGGGGGMCEGTMTEGYMHHIKFKLKRQLCDFRLLPQSRGELCSSGLLSNE